MQANKSLVSSEFKAIFSLSTILAFRMLGLFMLYPVFSLSAQHFSSATPSLIGLALGIYGLTQGVLQFPFSVLSDRIGRKPVITMGLLLFFLGSVIAACTNSIYMIILGRALQGAGAIGSTLLAFAADMTTFENRTKAMAILGMTIGASFGLAMIIGPILNNWLHLSGLFWVTALFAVVGMLILYLCTPNNTQPLQTTGVEPVLTRLKKIMTTHELIHLNIGVFILHAILTASFIFIPQFLHEIVGVETPSQWMIYLPVLSIAFVSVLPLIHLAEKKNFIKIIMMLSIIMISAAQFLWYFSLQASVVIVALLLFFIAFTLLEALLPSLVSKLAPIQNKGAALGIFSSSQFLGIFIGGVIGGMMQNYWGNHSICLFAGVITFIWCVGIFFMKPLPHLKTELIRLNHHIDEIQARRLCDILCNIPGILEAIVSIQDSIAYLKVDNKILSQERLQRVKADFQEGIQVV